MLYFLVGQSNTGKDTIMGRLLELDLGLERFVYCTTRPAREGEINGKDYWFKTEEDYKKDLQSHKIVESRDYARVDGIMHYYSLDDIDLEKDYIAVGSIWQCQSYVKKWGSFVRPIRIVVDDYNRLIRAIEREKKNKQDYKEVCRRFNDEFVEYCDENWNTIDFWLNVENTDLDLCCRTIQEAIRPSEEKSFTFIDI